VRELTTFLDWHLEMTARQLYGPAFFGAAPLSEGDAARIRAQLVDNIAAFKRLARFSPYVAGDSFSQADCAAFNHLPLVAMASKAVYGEDLLQAAGIDHRSYVRYVAQRPAAQKVVADRKAAQAKL
jgi:glutathione S-transferase